MHMRTSVAKAPASRVYSSEPRLRQQRFPPRTRSVKTFSATPNTKDLLAKQQSTLTQIDFINVPSSYPDSTDESGDDESPGSHCLNQRTRIRNQDGKRSTEQKRQETLTQMKDFFVRDSDSEAEIEGFIEDEQTSVQANRENHKAYDFSIVDGQDDTDHAAGRMEDDLLGLLKQPSPTQRHAKQIYVGSDTTSPLPRHRIRYKNEIPSSQSPSPSPLSTTASPSPQPPSHSQRVPLAEIHSNILAKRDQDSRDSHASGTPKKKRRMQVADSSSEDSEVDDVENYDPHAITKTESEKGRGHHSPTEQHFARMHTPNKLTQSENTASAPWEDCASGCISQASTVEFATPPTQPSSFKEVHFKRPPLPATLRRGRPESSPVQVKSSPPGTYERSVGTFESQMASDAWQDAEPIASVQDSADIITATQMMRSSCDD